MASACGEVPSTLESEPLPAAVDTVSQQANSARKVLILSSSVNGGAQSREAQAAAAQGFTVELATPAQWKAMRATEFMTYRALIIGDAGCTGGDSAFKAAVDSRNNWGHIVDGNIVIVGADPASNHTPELVENAIAVAVERPRETGLYVALGCAYRNAQPGTEVPLLETFGTFKVAGVNCANSAHLFAMRPETIAQNLTNELLTGNGCAARSVFTQFPENNFSYVALGMHSNGSAIPGQQAYTVFTDSNDSTLVTTVTGAPYVLVRGASAASAGCGWSPHAGPGEQCDKGDFGNGQPAVAGQPASDTCSWSCHLNWCGDGVVNAGEECDNGISNGRTRDSSGNISACSESCKRMPNLPPVARCKDVPVEARNTCSMPADINDGSYDPENMLAGCTVSKAGPYPTGETRVTLTCTDTSGQSSSCDAKVTVTDVNAPVLTLNGAASETVQCGEAYHDAGATARKLCGGDLSGSISVTDAPNTRVPASYSLTYGLNGFPNIKATRDVRVVDTTPPHIECPKPIVTELTEGDLATVTLALATATDTCDGQVKVEGPQEKLFPQGDTKVTFTATDAAGNTASCDTTVTVLASGPGGKPIEKWDGAMLGGGFGCSAASGGAPLAMLGLMLSALLGTRRRQR